MHSHPKWQTHKTPQYRQIHLEIRLDGTQINGENNTSQRHSVIKQEKKWVIIAVELKALVSYFNRCTPEYQFIFVPSKRISKVVV